MTSFVAPTGVAGFRLRPALITLSIASLCALLGALLMLGYTVTRLERELQAAQAVRTLASAVAPPPLYPLEAINTAYVMVEVGGDITPLLKRYEDSKRSFFVAMRHWQGQSFAADPAIHAPLVAQQALAEKVFDIVEHRIVPAMQQGQVEAAQFMLPSLQIAIHALQENATRLAAATNARAEREAAAFAELRRAFFIGALIGAVLLAGGLSLLCWRISRRIYAAVGGEPVVLAHLARGIASGDLRSGLVLERPQPNSLGASFERMFRNLKDRVTHWQGLDRELAALFGSVRGLAGESQSRTVEQRERATRALAELASLRTHMDATQARTRDSAVVVETALGSVAQATRSTLDTLLHLESLSQTTEDARTALDLLEQDMQRVVRATGLIDEVAQRTRLLSLNAAIEAARAGEHGRGFSVVADEVRKLSEQSQQAAAEISQVSAGLLNSLDALTVRMQSGLDAAGQAIAGAAAIRAASEHLGASASRGRVLLHQVVADAEEQALAIDGVADSVQVLERAFAETGEQVGHIAQRLDEVQGRLGALSAALVDYRV